MKTSLAPGSQVVARISGQIRPAKRSRQARLQSGRLRLHHLHRQFRPAAGGNLQGDQRERSRRGRGAVRQPQFRGPRQRRRARELSRLAAAGGRLCDRGLDADRRRQDAARHRQQGQEGLSAATSGRPAARSTASSARTSASRCSPRNTATCSRATRNWRKIACKGGLTYRVGRPLDLRAEPALFRRHARGRTPLDRYRRRARARPVPRFDHHRPHLAGGLDQGRIRRPANI